jgi:creatinine amidohydrolase
MTVSKYWRHLKSADFAGIDRDDSVVILPLAAIEQHGPHLPLDVDLRINEGILSSVVECAPDDLQFLILPLQSIGYSAEHEAFPGTLSYPPAALIDHWTTTIAQAAALGFRRFLLFNSHGGNSDLMRIAVRELRVNYDVLAVAASWYRMVALEAFADAEELAHGIHGGLIETSVMLHLDPMHVDMSQATAFPSFAAELAEKCQHLSATGNIQFGWMAQDLNPAGAVGDPSRATAEAGKAIIQAASANLIELIGEVTSFDLSALSDEGS